jgi:hypothetical protein
VLCGIHGSSARARSGARAKERASNYFGSKAAGELRVPDARCGHQPVVRLIELGAHVRLDGTEPVLEVADRAPARAKDRLA